MRQRTNSMGNPNFQGNALVVAGLLILVLLAIPWFRLPYERFDWVALGQPYETSTPTATTTATVTLTATTTATATTTSTSPPPATETPTATSPPPATVTLTPPPAPPAGRDSLSARVFLDYRCDRFFQTSVDVPIPDALVTITFPDGSSATRATTLYGMAYLAGFDASGGLTVSVTLPSNFRGYSIASCPTSPPSIELRASDFHFGYKFVSFGALVRGELAGP